MQVLQRFWVCSSATPRWARAQPPTQISPGMLAVSALKRESPIIHPTSTRAQKSRGARVFRVWPHSHDAREQTNSREVRPPMHLRRQRAAAGRCLQALRRACMLVRTSFPVPLPNRRRGVRQCHSQWQWPHMLGEMIACMYGPHGYWLDITSLKHPTPMQCASVASSRNRYALCVSIGTTRCSIKQAKATKCSASTVSGKRS